MSLHTCPIGGLRAAIPCEAASAFVHEMRRWIEDADEPRRIAEYHHRFQAHRSRRSKTRDIVIFEDDVGAREFVAFETVEAPSVLPSHWAHVLRVATKFSHRLTAGICQIY